MSAGTLTDLGIRGLKPRPVRYEEFDHGLPGFGVRVAPSAAKSFVLVYRIGTRTRRLTLGRYPILSLAEARQKAREALNEVTHGRDPGAEKQGDRKATTFSVLLDAYLADPRVCAKRSYREDVRIGRRELLPALGRLRLKEIKASHIQAILAKIIKRDAPIMANRTHALARSIFNFAIAKEMGISENPCSRISRPAKESPRDRVYNRDEIRAVWLACENHPEWVAAALRLFFLTAARRSEVLAMRWSEIDFQSGTWTLLRGRTKNSRPHIVPLSSPAIDILRLRRSMSNGSEFVFPGRKRGCPVTNIQYRIKKIAASSGVKDLRLHDARRTVATGVAMRNGSRFLVGRLLNHADNSVTAIYDTYEYSAEKRDALEGWAQDLLRVVAEARVP